MSNAKNTAKNEVINAHVASLKARHASETKNNADASALKFIDDCTFTCSISEVHDMLKACEVSENFAQDKRISNKEMCMKAINSVDSILRFVFNDKHFTRNTALKSNVEECVRTVINFKNAQTPMTARDLEDCLNASAKISDDKKALIYQRATQFGAFKRHAQMTERALHALGILKQVNKAYVINDNAILKALEAKLSA
jgi:hypothetical protein